MITNAPYLLIPITAGLLILYFISLLFSHLEILSSKRHRQIWNYALLLTFLVTIVLGILMAIQINYKLEVPWTEKVLRWHVNFGIGMSLTGLFHLSWHFLYFVPFTKQLTTSEDPFPTDNKSLTGIHINNINFVSIPLVIGFSAILVQTVMIRELLALFQGNELTLSIIFLLWMAITGTGSITGSVARVSDQLGKTKSSAKVILLIKTLIFLPLVLMPLLYLLKKQFFAPGIEAGPLPFTALTCIILLPYCFLSGFAFTWSARVFQPDGSRLRHFYGWESAGGAIGGLIVTLTILLGMSSITVLFLGAAAVTLLLTILSKQNKTSGLILTVIVLAIGVSVHSVDLDRVITRMFHPNETVLATRPGTAGRITVTETGGQENIYENGLLVHSAGNIIVNEEIASFTLAQLDQPANILVIGGLLSGIEEALEKFSPRSIDFIATDPHLIEQAEHLGLSATGDKIRQIRKTPAYWVRHADQVYDAILINLPGPYNLHLNRFYATEFFNQLRMILAEDGVITSIMPGTANYVSKEAAGVLSTVRRAGLESFKHALVLPGENSYLLLSNDSLRLDILTRIDELGIDNLYVNRGYFNERLFGDRTELVNQEVSSATISNSVLRPVASMSQIAWWLGLFPQKAVWPVLILTVLVIVAGLWTGHGGLTGIFLLGAAASGSEILLLFLLQTLAGAIYQLSGLFLGIFMAGLAMGSLFYRRLPGESDRSRTNQALLLFFLSSGLLAILLPVLANHKGPAFVPVLVLLVIGFTIAAATGIFFAGLSRQMVESKIKQNRLYGYDLLGAGTGAIVFPLVIIPITGMLFGAIIITLSSLVVWLILLITARMKKT